MKVGRALAWMIVVVTVPGIVLTVASLAWLYGVQRDSSQRQVLERARAVRLAVDTEINGAVRTLRALADAGPLHTPGAVGAPSLADSLRRHLNANPMWSSLSVVSTEGTELLRIARPDAAAVPPIDAATRQAVIAGHRAVASAAIQRHGEEYYTYLAQPVIEQGEVRSLLSVTMPASVWLDYIVEFARDAEVVLTLSDASGAVIARTRNHRELVGRPPTPAFWAQVSQEDEGVFQSSSLEGQTLAIGYSHLQAAPWLIANGVSLSALQQNLLEPASLYLTLVLLSGLVALTLAVWLGRRITTGLLELASVARLDDGEQALLLRRRLPLEEAEQVRAFVAQRLQSEAAARREAEAATAAQQSFVTTLSHELRSPLAAIGTAASLLQRESTTPVARERALQLLQRQVRQLGRLMDDLFESARLGEDRLPLQLAPVALDELAQAAADVMDDACRAADVRLQIDAAPVCVPGDELRLQQVLRNLLENAVKFSGPGSTVWLQVREGEGADRGWAVLAVRDEGVGIPAEALDQIFSRYYQVRAADPMRAPVAGGGSPLRRPVGLGLGLHIVRRIVELHGGRVEARSDGPGRGATMLVWLPMGLAPDATGAAALALPPARAD